MTKKTKTELIIFAQYYVIAILSLTFTEVMIFESILRDETGEINFAGYYRKEVYGRLLLLSVFFIIIGIFRLLLKLVISKAKVTSKGMR
jgi:hypothetical protein